MTIRPNRCIFHDDEKFHDRLGIFPRRSACVVLFGLALFALLSLAALAAHAGEAGMQHCHDASAKLPAGVTRSVASYALPDLDLVGTDGQARRLADEVAADEPVMVNFIFTTCTTVCPISSGTFAKVQSLLDQDGAKYRLVSISIDPEQDTPARLRQYGAKYGAGSQWHFLTGQSARIVDAQRAFEVYRGNKMNHIPVTLMRAGKDAPWVRYEGFVTPETLVGEFRQLVADRKLAMK